MLPQRKTFSYSSSLEMSRNSSLPPRKALEPPPLQESQHTHTIEEAFSVVALKAASVNTTPLGRGTADATIVPGKGRDRYRKRQRRGRGPPQPHGGQSPARPRPPQPSPAPALSPQPLGRESAEAAAPTSSSPPEEGAGRQPTPLPTAPPFLGGSGRSRSPRAPSPGTAESGSPAATRPRARGEGGSQRERPPPLLGAPREGSEGTRGRHRSRSPETYCGRDAVLPHRRGSSWRAGGGDARRAQGDAPLQAKRRRLFKGPPRG